MPKFAKLVNAEVGVQIQDLDPLGGMLHADGDSIR